MPGYGTVAFGLAVLAALEITTAPATAQAPTSAQWPMASKNYENTRYSDLDQITTANAKDLRLAWTFSTGVLKGHEAAPLVVGNTLYVVTPFPNVLYALDLTQRGALKWKYAPDPSPSAPGVACCDVVNRGAAYADGKIVFNTLDNHTVAVDAETGREVWKTKLGDINRGETMTMAPLVVKDKVFAGVSGGELGVRGWITALDLKTGRQVWRAYSTGPDRDVLIGPDFKAFYAKDQGNDLGVKTWPSDSAWKIGGGTVWGFLSYDPELNLLYYGSANPGPWNPDARPGDNKWTATIFARNPDTGQARWATQLTPHDMHDYDAINEIILVDRPFNGRMRKLLVHPDRNGFLYVMDRTTGEILSAEPWMHVNWATGIDLKTGAPKVVASKSTHEGKNVTDICPAAPGGKDWQPSAWSPKTGLFYIPSNNLCMDYEGTKVDYIEGTPYIGAIVKMKPGPGGHRGELVAWDIADGKKAWGIKENFPAWSGAVATAGDVVFYGTMDRWFKAVNARTGVVLWQFRTGSGVIGQPVTFAGPDGRQYVAVLDGVGGWAGAIVSGDLSPKDPTAALGAVGAMKDLPQHTGKGGTLYVFSLP